MRQGRCHAPLLPLKKSRNNLALSSARSPPFTCSRWFSRLSWPT